MRRWWDGYLVELGSDELPLIAIVLLLVSRTKRRWSLKPPFQLLQGGETIGEKRKGRCPLEKVTRHYILVDGLRGETNPFLSLPRFIDLGRIFQISAHSALSKFNLRNYTF